MNTVNDVINQELADWAISFINNRREAASVIPQASGKGARSFEHEVIKAAASEVARVLFAFEAHMRLADMRKLNWKQQPPTQDIIDWIKQRGVGKFLAGFERKYSLPKSNTRLLNQIAWGIVKKKAKTNKRKRHKWYNKSKERDISRLYSRLLYALSENQLQNIKKQFV